MLKPITSGERLELTMKIQFEKAIEELLYDLYEQKYNGFVDIWADIVKKKGKVVLDVQLKKIKVGSDPVTNDKCVRYHILPGKGVKKIKT